ncbi:hypothetical protein ACWD7C_22195 [Streptomyces sp. NPDC005134]
MRPIRSPRAAGTVALAADWPGTDTVVAVVVTEDPAELPAAVADVRKLAP